MADGWDARVGRRRFLAGAAAGAGWLMARSFGVPDVGGTAHATSYEQNLRALGQSLTPRQRQLVVFAADHPTRQIVNSQSVIKRPHLGTLFSPEQRRLIEQLYRSMLSPRGVDTFAPTVAIEGRFDGCILAIYGDPESGRAQTVIQGGHLMLRGGPHDAAHAFGGGISYGHQTGNGVWRVPGNSFAYHGDAANRLFAWLTPGERERTILPQPPHELIVQVQGKDGAFPGIRLGTLGEPLRDEAQMLLDTVFSPYPKSERDAAFACIEANGGLAQLHFATYASHGFYDDMSSWGMLAPPERARRGDPYWQVWRIEGPGTIIHFKGYPHVHAYIQVVRDPARVNVGQALALTDAAIEGGRMRSLLEAALRRATGERLAFYGNQIPGRFCPGEITTGLAYSLDPYRNHVSVATIDGAAMATPLREHLVSLGVHLDPHSRYRIASNDFTVQQAAVFGTPEHVDTSGVLVRDALVDHLRAGGLQTLPT